MAISSKQAIFNPVLFSTAFTNSVASVSASCVPVSSQAKPHLILEVLNFAVLNKFD